MCPYPRYFVEFEVVEEHPASSVGVGELEERS